MSKEVDGVLIQNWIERNLLGYTAVVNLPTTENPQLKYPKNKESPFTTKLNFRKTKFGSPRLEATIEGPADVPYLFAPFGWESYYVKTQREVSSLRFIVLEPAVATEERCRGRTRARIDLGDIPDHLTLYPPLMMLAKDHYLTDALTRSLLPVSVISSVVKYHTANAWNRLAETEPSRFKWINPTIIESVELAEKLCPPKIRMPHGG